MRAQLGAAGRTYAAQWNAAALAARLADAYQEVIGSRRPVSSPAETRASATLPARATLP